MSSIPPFAVQSTRCGSAAGACRRATSIPKLSTTRSRRPDRRETVVPSGRCAKSSAVATIRELERGTWLDDGVAEDVRREVESLCHLLSDCIADLVVSLSMFEQAYIASSRGSSSGIDHEEWERDAERRRKREAELDAEQGVVWGQDDWWERSHAIRDRSRRDVLREKWRETGGPEDYRRRTVFIHARSFVTTLALLQRSLLALCEYDLDPSVAVKLKQACDAFAAALPGLKGVRDSVSHAEDRVRGEAFSRKIVTKPVTNSMIHAPNGGVMVVDALNNQHFGGTMADGTYADVEVADATTEVARVVVQAVYDALPWRPGHRMFEPSC
jgi:hypothetical protein